MATDKLFSVAGISKLNGEYKVRFANDIMRIKVLAKSDHTDIRLDELDGSFDKLTAAKMLLTMDNYQDAVAQSTITEYIEDNTPKAPKAKAAPKAKTAPVKAPAKAKTTAKAVSTEGMDENIPF